MRGLSGRRWGEEFVHFIVGKPKSKGEGRGRRTINTAPEYETESNHQQTPCSSNALRHSSNGDRGMRAADACSRCAQRGGKSTGAARPLRKRRDGGEGTQRVGVADGGGRVGGGGVSWQALTAQSQRAHTEQPR